MQKSNHHIIIIQDRPNKNYGVFAEVEVLLTAGTAPPAKKSLAKVLQPSVSKQLPPHLGAVN